MPLATLQIDGKPRKVLMQAPKNGFYYVIDRETGKLIGAEKLGRVTWAERIDFTTGRPVERPDIRYEKGPVTIYPGNLGLHNWTAMAFSPKTGLAYIPTMDSGGLYSDAGVDARRWRHAPGQFNSALGPNYGPEMSNSSASALVAWDPVAQREAWRVATPAPWNGGTLATAGGLVFQGQIDGQFNAYDAKSGRKLWSIDVGNAIIGAPISYSVGGRQFISVIAAPPAGALMQLDGANRYGWNYRVNKPQLISFELDGKGKLPAPGKPQAEKPLRDASFKVDAALAGEGAIVYYNCMPCHGADAVSLGSAPDLRASVVATSPEAFEQVVRKGSLVATGMPAYGELDERQLLALRHYLRSEANQARQGNP
jgi:quinohemoprotein ethanol dehydrogenase